MGKCSLCGDKILYNKYKIIDGKPYCLSCAEKINSGLTKIVTPNDIAKEALKGQGIDLIMMDDKQETQEE